MTREHGPEFDLGKYFHQQSLPGPPPRRRVLILDSTARPDSDDRRRAVCRVLEEYQPLGLPQPGHPDQVDQVVARSPGSVEEQVLYCDLNGSPFVTRQYPRNVPWTNLPALSYPRRALLDIVQGWYNGKFRYLRSEPNQSLCDVEHVVAFRRSGSQHALLDMAHLQNLLGRTLVCHLFETGSMSKPSPVPQCRIAQVELESRALDRLDWNWIWNTEMLMPRLVEQAYHTRRPPGQPGRNAGSWESLAINALMSTPFALQVLYRVSQANPRPMGYDGETARYPGILSGLGTTRIAGTDTLSLDWTGHAVTAQSFLDYPANNAFLRHLTIAADRLYEAGLVLADHDRFARLSPAGARLLDLLPRGCRDLGMPTRWVKADGRIGDESDIPAMDRWMTTVLRHVKQGSNALHAALNQTQANPNMDARTGQDGLPARPG